MPRRLLPLVALALLPDTASAFWPYNPWCRPVYVVPYSYAPPVLPLYYTAPVVPYYFPPACECPPAAAAPAKPATSQGPRVYTEEKPVRPAGYAEPTVAPPEPPAKPEPKPDAIPRTNLPATPVAPPVPKVELELPKLPPPSPVPDPKPAAEPKPGEIKLPELPPLPTISKYRPDAGEDAVSVQLIPVTGRAGKPVTAEFWNYTGRRLTLSVDGREYPLPARHSVPVAVGGSFTWAMNGGPARTDRLAADAGGVEVVLK